MLTWLWELAEVKPAVLQNRFYRESGYDKKLRDFCAQNGIIYQSFWTLTANPQILESRVVQAISKQINKSPAQILFRYLMQHQCSPLTGTTSTKHMKEDIEACHFELTEHQCSKISQLIDELVD